MIRTYAEIGEEFVLKNMDGVPRTFVITDIKGEGGSALVYSAETANGMKSVIKEFFPILARDYSFTRTDGVLYIDKIVTVSEEFLSKAQRFVHSVSVMNRFAFSEETAEETLAAELFSNANGIPYMVTEWNPQRVVCYDDVRTNSLNEIATVCLRLTEITSKYHNMGYIHFDIKPSNILWSEKYHYIKLFDFDTVGQLGSCDASATQSYSAPEMGTHYAATAKSDLYSIGAILFERVMGRKIDPLFGDRVNFRYESELADKPLMANESDEAVALVKTILRGTICAAPGKRMNAEGLAELLKMLSETTRSEAPAATKPERRKLYPHMRNIFIAACGAVVCATAVIPVIFFNNDLAENAIDKREAPDGITQAKSTETVFSSDTEGTETAPDNATVNTSDAYMEISHSNERETADSGTQYSAATSEVEASSEPTVPTVPTAHATPAVTTMPTIPTVPTSSTVPTIPAAPLPPTVTVSAHTEPHTPISSSTETVSPQGSEEIPTPVTTEPTSADIIEEIYPGISGDFAYKPFENGIELVFYSGRGGDVVIPQDIDGMPVIKLGHQLFEDRNDITSVKMPDGLKIIDYSVFWWCTGLSEIIIPESVESIGSNAFYGASGVHSLYIPQNVKDIGGLCFGWTGLEKIEVSPQNNLFSSTDGILYNKIGDIMLCYPCCKPDKEFTVPDSVFEIREFTFDRPKYLEKLHIGKNLRTINDCQIFEYVKEITADADNPFFTSYDGALFNKNLTKLWFYPPNSERNVWTMPETVKALGAYCFTDLKKLDRLQLSAIPEFLIPCSAPYIVFNNTIYNFEEFNELYHPDAF